MRRVIRAVAPVVATAVMAAMVVGCSARHASPPPEPVALPSVPPPLAGGAGAGTASAAGATGGAAAGAGAGAAAGTVATTAAAASRQPPVAPGTLSAVTMVRLHVINFTSDSAPFIFRLGGVQLLDTTAAPGTLNVPVLTSTFRVGRGKYGVQLMDRRSGKVIEAPLEMGAVQGTDFATIEIIIESDSTRLTLCHCVRLYGGGGGVTSSVTSFDRLTAAR